MSCTTCVTILCGFCRHLNYCYCNTVFQSSNDPTHDTRIATKRGTLGFGEKNEDEDRFITRVFRRAYNVSYFHSTFEMYP